MPIQRFRTQEEARQGRWLPSGDPRIGPRLRQLWAFARRLLPPGHEFPRGVQKFRSIEEADRERERWS